MRKSVKAIVMIILFVIMCTISILSYAVTDEYKVNIQSEKYKFKPGETVKFVVSIEDIKLDEGIAAFTAIIDYDENIFEEVTAEEIDEWDTPTLVDDMIQVTRKDMLNSKEDQKVVSISLKIKEDVEISKTTIGLSKFDVTDGNTTIRGEGTSMDVEIEGNKIEAEIVEKGNNNIFIILGIVIVVTIVTLIIIKNKKK